MEVQTEFEKWIKDSELSADTVKLLQDHGFISVKSCRKLNDVLIQKTFKTLPLAQILLLQDAVQELQVPANEPTSEETTRPTVAVSTDSIPAGGSGEQQTLPSMPSASEGLDMARICQLLNLDKTPDEPCTHTGKNKTFDPFQYSLSGDSVMPGNSKARDVREYIMFGKQYQYDQSPMSPTTIKIGDTELSLNDKKLALEKITPLQYMEGSLKILCEMIANDRVNTETILDHIGFLTKMACMGQTFSWPSLMKYDAEYRKTQAYQGFPWGADSPFLMQLLLKQHDRDTLVTHTAPSRRNTGFTNQQHSQHRYDPKSGRVICGKFNGRNGCTLPHCRYAHVCGSCYDPAHGEFSHRHAHQKQPQQNNTTPAAPSKNWRA